MTNLSHKLSRKPQMLAKNCKFDFGTKAKTHESLWEHGGDLWSILKSRSCKALRYWIRDMVNGDLFELGVAFLITANALVMCVEVQIDGVSIGVDLQYPGHSQAKGDWWNDASVVFNFFDWLFGLLFFL